MTLLLSGVHAYAAAHVNAWDTVSVDAPSQHLMLAGGGCSRCGFIVKLQASLGGYCQTSMRPSWLLSVADEAPCLVWKAESCVRRTLVSGSWNGKQNSCPGHEPSELALHRTYEHVMVSGTYCMW
jgi:hypothetical protein